MVGRREGVGTGRDGTGGWVGVIGSGVCRRAGRGGGRRRVNERDVVDDEMRIDPTFDRTRARERERETDRPTD